MTRLSGLMSRVVRGRATMHLMRVAIELTEAQADELLAPRPRARRTSDRGYRWTAQRARLRLRASGPKRAHEERGVVPPARQV